MLDSFSVSLAATTRPPLRLAARGVVAVVASVAVAVTLRFVVMGRTVNSRTTTVNPSRLTHVVTTRVKTPDSLHIPLGICADELWDSCPHGPLMPGPRALPLWACRP